MTEATGIAGILHGKLPNLHQFTTVKHRLIFWIILGLLCAASSRHPERPKWQQWLWARVKIKWLSAHATIDRNVLVNRPEAWILTHSQTRGDITSRRLSIGNCVLWLLKRSLGKLAIELDEMIWCPSDPQLISPRLEWAARPTLPEICGKELSVMHLEQGTWFVNKSNLWDLTPLVHATCRWDLPTSMTWASGMKHCSNNLSFGMIVEDSWLNFSSRNSTNFPHRDYPWFAFVDQVACIFASGFLAVAPCRLQFNGLALAAKAANRQPPVPSWANFGWNPVNKSRNYP